MADGAVFVHRFVPGDAPTTVLALHGTGGDEHDLLPLAAAVAPGAGVLSPRGRVLENGMARFFRRIAEGVFDLEDLRVQAAALADFVGGAAERYGYDRARVLGLGLSHGANMAAALLLLHPGTLSGAVLFRPMVPLVPDHLPYLHGVRVWIGAGRADRMIPAPQTERLAALLRQAGAEVTEHWVDGGHRLTMGEDQAARQWLEGGHTR